MKQLKEISQDGSFQRQKNRFTTPFSNESGLPIEPGRYRLLWSPACPWAHRAVIVRELLGLDTVISLGTASPMRPNIDRVDWEFSLDEDCIDPVLKVRYISELYLNSDPSFSGRPTVPAVVDLTTKKVVNNDYFNLTNYFETVWSPYHKESAPNLYPEHLQKQIKEFNDTIFHDVNNGVYQCGFAHSQEAYEQAYDKLFARLDQLNQHLEKNRFLLGDYITDADIRLYTTLVRFDAAYYTAFNTNKHLIREYKNLWGYARDLYQTAGFGNTTDFDAIKKHYHLSITINPDHAKPNILPKGPDLSAWNERPERDILSKLPSKFLYKEPT
ncbi:glutathione S-transferase family protein [Alkalibacillus haloalkaliphilus]|uniref:glutathione S-transferase family protein n=1 Tax=Alkalibacillus haloalkaliphilus TaxID=94136 RepID=UPI002936B3BA|nr:glutathione S-transferase C-terminal domain-containing protein [Alkalibacillus haloalkaliphilus]MDV2583015.1 glutathione S-transferase C-terminal domain-containing protein [Alkalibacillus haloalkaliphilus]